MNNSTQVEALRSELKAAREENTRLKLAMAAIQKHVEISGGALSQFSAVRKIAGDPLKSTPAPAEPNDTAMLDWFMRSEAYMAHCRDGEACHLIWPHDPNDEEGDRPIHQKGIFDDGRAAIRAAMNAEAERGRTL